MCSCQLYVAVCLPGGSKDQSSAFLGDMVHVIRMTYADGTPEHDAIVNTYAYGQRLVLIAGVAIMPLTVLSIFVWKNINVKELKQERQTQTQGTVL
jgi:hypothetical protein